jgi:AcrR family transcriptional regulator
MKSININGLVKLLEALMNKKALNKSNEIPSNPVPKQKRSREKTSQKLLKAGLKVFSKYGYDAASTKLVAKEAGVNVALINWYFKSKEGLLLAILKDFRDNEIMAENSKNYPPGKTLEEEIYNFSIQRLDHMVQNKNTIRILISRALVDPKVTELMLPVATDSGDEILYSRLLEFQKNKKINPTVDVKKVAFAITMMTLSTNIFGHVLIGFDRQNIINTFKEFAHDYAEGISPKN